MHPVLCKIGPLTVYSYGVMVAIGFAIAICAIYRRAPACSLDREKVIDYAVLVLVAGIGGARLLYVAIHFRYYLANPLDILNLSKGGLIWYGGFVMALIASVWFVRAKKLDFWSAADLVAPYIALAQAFGRIGCFLNGCCYGIEVPAGRPLAADFAGDGVTRLPTQLYSAALLVAIFAVLRLWQDRKHYHGEIFLAYCMLYAAKRFMIEFLRGDNPRIIMGLTMSQAISVGFFAFAAAFFIYRLGAWKKEIPSGSK